MKTFRGSCILPADPASQGPAALAPATVHDAATAAILRAVPITRMIDYGLDIGSCQRILARVDGGTAWDVAAEAEAQRYLQPQDSETPYSRAARARVAAAALIVAQLAMNQDTPRKIRIYEEIYAALAEWVGHSRYVTEILDIPYRGGAMSAISVRPARSAKDPVVLVFGGLSGWGPAYIDGAEALAARGLHAILVELPGQGRTRLRDGLYAEGDVTAAVSTVIDFVEAAEGVRSGYGVWGNSFGGLFAAQAAAHDRRISACCVNGAPAALAIPSQRTAREQMLALCGTEDEDRLAAFVDAMSFADRGYSLRNVLVLHGGSDQLLRVEDQQPFVEAGMEHASIRLWDDGEHTLYNYAIDRNAFVSDWFAKMLT